MKIFKYYPKFFEEFVYVEQRKKDLWLIRECSSCTIEKCIDYEIEQGRAIDATKDK